MPLWISVGGFCAQDYAETCAALDDVEAIELNLSCPNVDEAPESAAEIVAACRAATALPLYAKLSAAHSGRRRRRARGRRRRRRRAVAREHAARHGARPADARPGARARNGRLSGPTLKPVALAAVHACYAATKLPIVGMGGVDDRTGRARADRVRREARRARHGSLLRSGCSGARSRRAAARRGGPRRCPARRRFRPRARR